MCRERLPVNEVYLIKLILQLPERKSELTDMLSSDDFTEDMTKSIYEKIRGSSGDFGVLMAQCNDSEKAFLTRTSFMADFEKPDKAFADCLARLRGNRKKEALKVLQQRVREAEAAGNAGLLRQLQEEQQALMRQGKKT